MTGAPLPSAPPLTGILETVLYAGDLAAAEAFYGAVLGLKLFAKQPARHLFYRCGEQMLLIFNPAVTHVPPAPGALPVPPHGMHGYGHLCFRASADQIAAWRGRLTELGIVIDADFVWPNGGRSLYFRDPAGNSLEFAEPVIWDLA